MGKSKFCCFYVSDIHLITMLLPYINEKINDNKEIITIFETDISKNAEKVIKSVNLKETESRKLLNINWNKCSEDIEKMELENKIIFVMGNNFFIEKTNCVLNNKDENFTIINCYEFIQTQENIDYIMKSHDKIINTKGETTISNFSQKEQEKITIVSQI